MFGGIAAAGSNRLVFATVDGDVVTLDAESGRVDGQFSRNPAGPKEVRVSACAMDGDGTLLVADARNRCLRRFGSNGTQIERLGRMATPGIGSQDEQGVLDEPCAILPADGGVLVACGGFEVEHGVQRVGGGGAGLSKPEGLWLRAQGLARIIDEFWVAETEAGLIHRFRLDGGYIERVAMPEELRRPFRIASDGYGGVLCLFAPETGPEQEELGVAHLSREGLFEDWEVLAGDAPGNVYCPFDLAVLPDGRFAVADLPTGTPPDVRLQLFSADGRLLATLFEDRLDLNAALKGWFDSRLGQGTPYEQARVHHVYSGGGEEHLDRARELYRAAQSDEADRLSAHLHLATLLEPQEAEAEYLRALECGGDAGDLAALIARCREAGGDLDGAIEMLKEAVEGPHPPEEYHRWVELLGTWYLRRAGEAP